MSPETITNKGGCSCGHVRYQLSSDPFIVHCCHCRWCQRQTGTAFALNALFEADQVELLEGEVHESTVSSPSGRGQKIARCPKCQVALWSNYHMGGLRDLIRFIRVGTLDDPDLLPPDVHIYTSSKQPWVTLPAGDLAVEEFYDFEKTWSPENQERRQALLKIARENSA
jgi:hypothetical protein